MDFKKSKEGKTMKLSMIIPCYNEEKNVELFYERVKEVFADHNFEI